LEEKNDTVETLNEKIRYMEEEVKNLAESHDKLTKKCEKYEELGGMYFSDDDDEQNRPRKNPQNALQKEIIKVSQQLKLKDRIIQRISDLPDLTDKIKKILNMENEEEKMVKKEEEDFEEKLISSILDIKSELSLFKDRSLT
jgi:hypothetical protein